MVAVALNPNSSSSISQTSTSSDKSCVFKSLESVPNFRLLCPDGVESVGAQGPCTVFRSSRPDLIKPSDLGTFKELGIRCIIDFRSKQEYMTADGHHLLDQEYPLYRVKFPSGRNFRHDEPVTVKQIAPNCSDKPGSSTETVDSHCRHYLINFFTLNYIWEIFNRAPWYIRLFSLVCLLYDYIFTSGHKHFVRLFARTTLNTTGIVGQYKDMIEYSQRSICAALKLLCKPDNLPALLNCAHGKDRTGIVSALVLYCLGKSPDYIANEYALSAKGLEPVKSRLFSEVVERFHMSEDFISAQAETMQQLFDYINCRYGSVENYLEYIGFGSREQARLRSLLLVEVEGEGASNQSEKARLD